MTYWPLSGNTCFNSATPACAWRRVFLRQFVVVETALQFGHACLRVETYQNLVALARE